MICFCLFKFEEIRSDRDCVFECGPDKTCFVDTCCATAKVANNHSLPPGSNDSLRQRSNCQMIPNGESQGSRQGGNAIDESSGNLQKPSVDNPAAIDS